MQDTSTNLSKLQREHLLDICSKIKKQEPVEIVEIAELEQFIKSMKYGLNFEKHEEPVDRMLRTHIPVFKEFKEVINNPESADCNFLLEGDNLHSLKLLEKTHKGRIDVCYLDPPYNTLNEDFAYGDKMLDENDGFKHSKWLSFMKERLQIARKLLADDGVIFISIDDNELYDLKLLCDEIFGEENFINNFMWLHGKGKKNKQSRTLQQYNLCYAKNKNLLKEWKEKSYTNYKFTNPDNDPKGPWFSGSISFAENRSNPLHENYYEIESPSGIKWKRQWQVSKSEMKDLIDSGDIYFGIAPDYDNIPRRKIRPSIVEIIPKNILEDCGTTKSAENELFNILGAKYFSYPKPCELIKHFLRFIDKDNAMVLDFFAGSGTTGHAVMDLNKEDGGNRHFILCTNNEVSTSKYLDYIHSKDYMKNVKTCGKSTQSKINKFFEDNPDVYKKLMVDSKNDYETYGICQSVTFPRLNTVITGIRPDGTKYSDGIEANLRYFQTDMIAKSDEDLDELLYEASFCLAELDCMSRIDGKTICIAECDEDVDDIIQNATDNLKIVFVAYDVFFDTEQQEFFDRHHIEIKRIPDCFYTEY